ncbi:MAG: DUF2207 domain-containing protein [Bacillota bacterium]|nr:DUF2207 domain-containing protein [Eubacteriales bacterium]MDD4285839.1 DUF2207 domain-containing protein [Eubacteriales bacterium]MDI9491489.1 DUF2207 domain-containing protein [Bacillota bacterium]
MKRNRKKVSVLIFVCLGLLLSLPWIAAGQDIRYDTLDYHVDLTVRENNSFVVQETITVDFHSPAHGIYRYITTGGEVFYRDDSGELKSISGRLHIGAVDAGDVPVLQSRESENVVIRLGSADETVTGRQVYTLRYEAEAYDDGVPEFDQVYWDLIPTGWETPIEQASFRIEMPRAFDDAKLEWIIGSVGSGRTGEVSWSKDGNIITGKLDRSLYAYEGVTLRILLPEGYFSGERTDTWMAAVAGLLGMAAALGAFLLFLRFGKDKKVIPVVEFYPPDDLSPAEVGYILNGTANTKDVLSLIPYFAHKGYMEIRRLDPEKRFFGKDVESFELHKMKDLPQSAPQYQKVFFDGLFSFGDPINTKEIPKEFGDTFKASQDFLASHFNKNSKKRVYHTSSMIATGAGCLLTFVPMAALFVALGLAVLAPEIQGALILAALASFVIALLSTIFMRKRTEYSAELMGRLKGFKNFIKVADLDRIKTLVHEDPQYFYNVLPYAYVFGLTDEWMRNFEGLEVQPPSWYTGNVGAFHMLYLMNSINTIADTLPTAPPADKSSFGGGGSFGGGFSGGGFGGGGGGAW